MRSSGASFFLRRLLTRAVRRPARGPRRLSVLILGLLLIAVWQKDFFARADKLDDGYQTTESTGMNQEWRFLYFLYYLDLFPVVANDGHAFMRGHPGYNKFERAAAEQVIARNGASLSMETDQTIRAGETGRTLLYLPYALWAGDARDPRLAPTHAAAFALALGALYAAFWWARDPVLGGTAVALLGSNPYQLYETHFRENIFGWTITAGLLTLALCLPLLRRRRFGRLPWAIPVAVGILLASVRQIRPEPVAILASAGLACLLVARTSWPRRIAMAAVLAVSFVGGSAAWQAYFDHKFDEAAGVVSAAGGQVYQGRRDRYHMFWHPMWCGLGDFGREYGYEWRDKAALRYASRKVELRYHELGKEPDWENFFWDPVYDQVLKEKVLGDIRQHPAWYLGVLARRMGRVLTWTTPVRLAAGPWHVDLPWNGLAALPVLLILAATRSWSLLKVAVFPLGTSLPTVLVFSGTVPGQTYAGWFHLLGAAIALAAALAVARELAARAWRSRAAAERGADPA
jgi:hypothetical protein